MPTCKNQPQVDALVLCNDKLSMKEKELPKLLLFQATISSTHSFIPHYILDLVNNLTYNNKPKDPEFGFIFVVSCANFDKFKYQHPQKTDGKTPLTITKGSDIPQYALAIDDDMMKHLTTCVDKLANELGTLDVLQPLFVSSTKL